MSDNIDMSGLMDKLSPSAKSFIMERGLEEQRENLREDIIKRGKTDLKDDDMTLYKKPRSGCKHCYGTGREGRDHNTKEAILCRCMRRGRLSDSKIDEFISAKELLMILDIKGE